MYPAQGNVFDLTVGQYLGKLTLELSEGGELSRRCMVTQVLDRFKLFSNTLELRFGHGFAVDHRFSEGFEANEAHVSIQTLLERYWVNYLRRVAVFGKFFQENGAMTIFTGEDLFEFLHCQFRVFWTFSLIIVIDEHRDFLLVLDLVDLFAENAGYSVKVAADSDVDREAYHRVQSYASGKYKLSVATSRQHP